MGHDTVPKFDLPTATRRIVELEEKVSKLVEVVKLQQKRLQRNDELNRYLWYRGVDYKFWKTEGPGHSGRKPDTYYPRFDTTDK